MPVRVHREEFLHVLESIQPGLTPKDEVDQSSCFIFDQGLVVTYNDEVCCRMKSPLGEEVQGAVKAKKFMDFLSKLPEDDIQIEAVRGGMEITTDRRRNALFLMEGDIHSKYGLIERPKDWKKLPKDFCEAVGVVQECAREKGGQFTHTMIHVHPDYIEASDDFELCRWTMKTGFEKELLLRKSCVRHINSLAMMEYCETKNWVHFRNEDRLELACRRYEDPYFDYTPHLKVDGVPTTLPKGFVDETKIGVIFASEGKDDTKVEIEMCSGKTRLIGTGAIGKYTSPWRKTSYEGDSFSFFISPGMLSSIADKYNECVLGKRMLFITSDKWVYVALLTAPADDKSNTKPKKQEIMQEDEEQEEVAAGVGEDGDE